MVRLEREFVGVHRGRRDQPTAAVRGEMATDMGKNGWEVERLSGSLGAEISECR